MFVSCTISPDKDMSKLSKDQDFGLCFLTIEFFAVFTKMADLTFLSMLYISTDASILSYVKMLSHAKYLIPDICGQHLNYLELYKC